jgi:hypothetical protein
MSVNQFQVTCDASGYAVGAVLMQDGNSLVYENRKMTSAEMNYKVGEQELLAVIHAFQVWRCYLEGSVVRVINDHHPNTYLQTQVTLSRRQGRWSEYLQRFDFTWEYCPGKTNVADPLSTNAAFLMAISTRRVKRGEVASAVATADAPRKSAGQPALSLDVLQE